VFNCHFVPECGNAYRVATRRSWGRAGREARGGCSEEDTNCRREWLHDGRTKRERVVMNGGDLVRGDVEIGSWNSKKARRKWASCEQRCDLRSYSLVIAFAYRIRWMITPKYIRSLRNHKTSNSQLSLRDAFDGEAERFVKYTVAGFPRDITTE
jgi:hypothetical protein